MPSSPPSRIAAEPTHRPGPRNPRAAAVCGLAFALAACDTPQWRAAAEPADARLVVDGQVRGPDPVAGPIPYYGTVDLAAVPALAERPARHAARGQLQIDEPVTPWIFPLDFVVESAVALFAAQPLRTVTLELEARRDLPATGDEPEEAGVFAARARSAAVDR